MKIFLSNSVVLFCLVISILLVSCAKEELVDPIDLSKDSQVADSTIQVRAAPVITSITGPTYTPYVSNGKWLGNVPGCGNGLYYGYYVVNTHNNNDDLNYWYINGSGFGTSGTVTSSSSGVTLQVLSWTSTKIKVRPKASYLLDYKTNLTITVKPTSGPYATRVINVLGMLANGRGYGQCTWEAAYQRKLVGLPIPLPSAYTSTSSITVSFVPKKNDVVHWGTSHTASIISTPTVTVSNGITTYSFLLRERNHNCGESAITTTKTFKKSSSQITQGIKSHNSNFGSASKYFR